MALREFTDRKRTEWRVWDVSPTQVHPATRGEDYMDDFRDGWLVFESHREKRRLEAPYPSAWTTFDIPQLEELCERARPVLRHRSKRPSSEHLAIATAEAERSAEAESDSRRTFLSPHGREWTVRIHECLDREGVTQKVLRFTAGDTVVELLKWPENWQDLSVVEFAVLLLDAEPPRRRAKGLGPQRRRDDREA